MAPLIQLQGVQKHYIAGAGEVRALDGIHLTVETGEYVAITGPSGSGKSTLLHIMGCLDSPTSGSYLLEGMEVSAMSDEELSETRNARIGFVFQNFNLLPRYSALRNVELPLIYSPSAPDRRRRALRAMESVHMDHRRSHRPNALSGGECQRVAMARALVNDPAIILADEPTGNLDSSTGLEIIALLERLSRERQMTVVMVTHDKAMAARANRVIELKDGLISNDSGRKP